MRTRIFATTVCVLGLAGCQTTDQQLDAQQQQAVQTALSRVRFDMNCPSATGEVLSRQMIQPVSIRFGVERAEYTVGVEGCGQRQTIIGYIKITSQTPTASLNFWTGLMHEQVRTVNDKVTPVRISVGF
jgi:hypothetical protein